MRIAILSGGDGWHVRDLKRAAAALGHVAEAVDFRTLSAAVPSANPCGDLAGYDGVIVRTMPPGSLEQVVFRMDILQALEARGVPVLNPPKALEVCVDKYLALERLSRHGLPVPETVVCQQADAAMAAFEKLGRDVVVKPIFGSEGRGLVRVTDPELAWRTFRAVERTDAVLYLQKFIPHPGWDLRAFVLNGQVVAAMKRTSKGDWRTNVAQGATADVVTLTPEQTALALSAASAVGTIAAGVDLLPGPAGEWYVVEVNAVPGWKSLAPTTGVDVAALMVQALADGRGTGGGQCTPHTPCEDRLPASGASLSRAEANPHTACEEYIGRRNAVRIRDVLLACTWEATAEKAGNVHPRACFDDLTHLDFILSGMAIAPVMAKAYRRPLGETVLEAVTATRQVVASNTNLGIVLLLAPLAAVPDGEDLQAGVGRVLAATTVQDSANVFEAIHVAVPGGLGEAKDQDVRDVPTMPFRDVMALAADRDQIAAEYANGFDTIFRFGVPTLLEGLKKHGRLEPAIQHLQLRWLAEYPDTLIARKRGVAVAREASDRARAVLAAGGPGSPAFLEFDRWLRSDGHARNPGTTADLVTACLYVALRQRTLTAQTPW